MSGERLSGMALMAVHRERAGCLDVQKVIDELAKKPRRINLVLQ